MNKFLKISFHLTFCVFILPTISIAKQLEVQDPEQFKLDLVVVDSASRSSVGKASLGATKNVHRVGDLFLSGQFTAEDIEIIKQNGIDRVVSLRTDGEIEWNEKKALEDAGLEFESVPFRAPETLTDKIFTDACQLLRNSDGKTLMHCGSANRAGAVWMVHRVLHDKVSLEQARKEAKIVGLKTEAYEDRAVAYIDRQLAKRRGTTNE